MLFFRNYNRWVKCVFVFIFGMVMVFSQTSGTNKELMDSYEAYTSLPREIIYLHTNKTDFLLGEQLGFKAYVIDKRSRRLANKTSNLYVQIVDEDNKTYSEQLLQVKKGVAYGTFLIDSTFNTQGYIIKAFTNWSRNFEEPNTFQQVVRIVADNSNNLNDKGYAQQGEKLSVSFMPEGGRLVANTLNSLGLSVKDEYGFGVPDLTCRLLDENNEVLKVFRLNEKGLAKVLVTPKDKIRFRLSIAHKGEEQLFTLPKAAEFGFSLMLANRKKSVLFKLNTNDASLAFLKKNNYRLAVHNGSEMKLVALPKFKKKGIAYNIPKELLFAGINIFTVFDETNLPLAERLYFFNEGIKINGAVSYQTEIKGDSIAIDLNFNEVGDTGNLSISILPEETVAHSPHQSLASSILLRPHLANAMENAADYFVNEDAKLAKDLDLVLLTQGWSAYEWSNVMHFLPKAQFDFEKGIQVKIANKKNRKTNYIAFPHQGNELRMLKKSDAADTFITDSLFPYQEDLLRISNIAKNGDFREPIINEKIEFLPNKIPSVQSTYEVLGYRTLEQGLEKISNDEPFKFALPRNNIALEEVVVTENKIEDSRLRNLIDFSFGKVTVFDEKKRKKWPSVLSFLQMQNGVEAIDLGDSIHVNLANVYLDGVPIKSPVLENNDLSLLIGMSTEEIAYIEVNRHGLGEGLRGTGGVVKIFTRTDYSEEVKNPYEYLDYEYPLTFSFQDGYAVPLYSSYSNATYRKFGVVGWFPNLSINENGKVKFTIPRTNLEKIRLHIQGITDNGALIAEEKIITLR